jgi:hypothetical protein
VLQKGRQYTSVSLRQCVSESTSISVRSETSAQRSSVSGFQEATSAVVLIVIVTCVAVVNRHSE